MNNRPRSSIFSAFSEDWWDGYHIGKKENRFACGLIVGVLTSVFALVVTLLVLGA